MKIIDRVINGFSAFMGGSYNGASKSRPAMRDYRVITGDANADTVYDLETLRARSRDLVRNSPLGCGAIDVSVLNTIGTGLSMQPNPDGEFLGWTDEYKAQWIKQVRSEWELFCNNKDCDASRMQNFYQLTNLAFRSMLESGDCIAITPSIKGRKSPYQLAIQIIEGDRLINPGRAQDSSTRVAGVTIDDNGAPVSYSISKKHPGAVLGASLECTEVEAYGKNGRKNVIHLFHKKRPGQVRGVPFLSPVIEILKQVSRHTEAELQAAVIASAFAVFMRMDPEAFGSLFDDDTKQRLQDGAMKWKGDIATTLDGPGKVVNLLPGEEPVAVNLGHPNANFDPFFLSMVTQVGTALGIPREVLLKSFQSSYSASRAALLDFWKTVRVGRDFMVTDFCDPIKELWFEEAVARNRISAPGFFNDVRLRQAYTRAVWIGDGQGSIEPLKEVNAAKERINLGISTREKESMLHDGGDWESNLSQLIKENDIMVAGGIKQDPQSNPLQFPESV